MKESATHAKDMETRESAKGQVTTMGNFNSQNTCSLLLMYLEHVIYIPPIHYVTFSQNMVETKSITIDYTPVHKSFNTGIIPVENSVLFKHCCNMNTATCRHLISATTV